MEDIIQEIIKQLYSASEEECEALKEKLISLADTYGKSNVVSCLETKKRSELLSVQWEIDEVLEILNPPKKVEEEIDDPSTRRLRGSELELRYADPQGIRLFSSKVDSRWVISRMDPRTGGAMQQEINEAQAEQIIVQLAGSPYWIKPPEPKK